MIKKRKSFSRGNDISKSFILKAVKVIMMLLFIFAAVFVPMYNMFQSIALKAISKQNEEFSSQVEINIESMKSIIKNIIVPIYYSPEVKNLSHGEIIRGKELKDNLDRLNAYVSSCEFIDCINVYNSSNGMIYTTSNKYVSDFCDNFKDKDVSAIFSQLNKDSLMEPIHRYAGESGNVNMKGVYSYIFFDENMDDSNKMAVMLDVPAWWYQAYLLEFDTSNSVVIMNNDGGLIASKSESKAVTAAMFWNHIQEKSQKDNDNGYIIGKGLYGEETVCTYYKMNNGDGFFINVMPYYDCLPGLLDIKNKVFLVVGIVLFLIAAALVAGAVYIYFPFRKVSAIVNEAEEDRASGSEEQLSDRVEHLVENSINMEHGKILRGLIDGSYCGENIITKGEQAILIIMERQYEQKLSYYLKSCSYDSYLAAINSRICGALIAGCIGSIEKFSKDIFKSLEARCYISSFLEDDKSVRDHYERLIELSNIHLYFPESKVLFECEIDRCHDKTCLYDEDVKLLISSIKSGEKKKAEDALMKVTDSIKYDRYRDLCYALERLDSVITTLYDEAGYTEGSKENDFEDMIVHWDDYNELCAYFKERVDALSFKYDGCRKEKAADVANRAARIIEEEYDNLSLTPGIIAERMDMSSAYLGRLFRGTYGKSVNEYINTIRISRAEELLISTELKVEDIAKKVGFENEKYFFVLFKKHTGMTPLRYRKDSVIIDKS